MTQVPTCDTATTAWTEIKNMFASQTRTRAVNLRIALANTKMGRASITDYFAKMKALGDEMAAARRWLDEELVEYIITGITR